MYGLFWCVAHRFTLRNPLFGESGPIHCNKKGLKQINFESYYKNYIHSRRERNLLISNLKLESNSQTCIFNSTEKQGHDDQPNKK